MCGIAGILLRPGAALSPGLLEGLAASLAHRGPDGSGAFTAASGALVHTRLAIIDLATGEQPIFDGKRALIANGEIYNYRELRAALPGDYATQSDCEPPLKCFARDGAGYASALRGMYAIAIYDEAAGEMVLSRDLFGIKPLYVAETPAGVMFASEPQALLNAGVARDIDRTRLHELLQLQFCTESIFSGLARVAPGETLVLRDGEVAARFLLPFPEVSAPPATLESAVARLDAVLQDAVDVHQRSDVPYGMFLSGGVDSAAILAMMARLNASPVLAFTAGFDEASVADERSAAAETARAAGARHERVLVTQEMVWAHLPEIVAAMDDPVADYAIIPTWFLARHARQAVKVILSGEGGDEMFAGYGRYRAAARGLWPKRMRKRGVFDGLDVLRAPPAGWRDGMARAEAGFPAGSRLKAAQRVDMVDWLPHDLLLKLDRCLMAHGVEGRTPFVDREMAAFAFGLPDAMVVKGGMGKYVLRLWLERHLPAARPFAKKQGFDVPVGSWIAAKSGVLGELLVRQPVIAELAAADRVKALLARAGEKRAGFAAWVLLFVALWHRRHVLGLAPAGDMFETLRNI